VPLPATRVIHPRFSAHHRAVAAGGHTGAVRITRPAAAGTTGPDGTWMPPPVVVVYEGPASVSPRPTTQRAAMVQGERRIVLREYIVGIVWDAAVVAVDDLVEVTGAADPLLAGVVLRVADVQGGAEQWERMLVCTENVTEAGV